MYISCVAWASVYKCKIERRKTTRASFTILQNTANRKCDKQQHVKGQGKQKFCVPPLLIIFYCRWIEKERAKRYATAKKNITINLIWSYANEKCMDLYKEWIKWKKYYAKIDDLNKIWKKKYVKKMKKKYHNNEKIEKNKKKHWKINSFPLIRSNGEWKSDTFAVPVFFPACLINLKFRTLIVQWKRKSFHFYYAMKIQFHE